MKTRYYILLLAGTCVTAVNADVLTPQQAYEAAMRQTNVPGLSRLKSAQATVPSLTVKAAGDAAVYVFSGDNGCLVASAESETPALLGYLDVPMAEGERMPDAMLYWIDYYANEIRQLREGKVRRHLLSAQQDYAAVEPFVKTTWNQGSPYNNLCPMLGDARSVTGCVATGMAQAIKVFNWPEKGKGEISYRWSNGGEVLSADFSESVYAWDKMLDSYTGHASREERTAVATLMRDCGYSVGMNYSPRASGAQDVYIPSALYEFFDYDRSIRFEQREYFYTDEWTSMVYEEVAAGRPVIYCGSGEAGGHCFVCDGYSSEGYFHFNWGWGGVSDGYFRLSALAPGIQGIGGNDSNFNSNQSVVVSMRRPEADSKLGIVLAAMGSLYPRNDSYTAGSSVRFGGVSINNYSVESVSGVMGLKLIPAEGEPVYVQGQNTLTFGTVRSGDYSQASFRVPVDNFPASGKYIVVPSLYSDGEWHDVEMSRIYSWDLQCTVADGTVSFARVNSEAQLDITDFEVTSPIYEGKPFSVKFDAANVGTKDYYGDMVLVLTDDANSLTNTSFFTVDLAPGESENRTVYTEFLSAVDPGDYYLYLVNYYSQVYAGPVNVTIQEAPAEDAKAVLSDLKVTNAIETSDDNNGNTVYTVDPSDIKISGNVTCTQGYLSDPVRAYIFNITGGTALAGMGQSFNLLAEGASATVNFEGAYSAAEENTEYMIGFFLNNVQLNELLYVKTQGGSSATMVKAGDLDYTVNGDMLRVAGAESGARTRVYSADGILVVDAIGDAVDISAARSGVYMIVVTSGDKVSAAKIVR